MTAADLAAELRRLHDAPEPLVLVNVWDVASARVVAGLPGCTALATASHASRPRTATRTVSRSRSS